VPGREIWRLYSMANAPREDQTLDFHVRMIDGGTSGPTCPPGTCLEALTAPVVMRTSGRATPKHLRNIAEGRFTRRKQSVTSSETPPGDAEAQRRGPERQVA
jgi:hypothetical protein